MQFRASEPLDYRDGSREPDPTPSPCREALMADQQQLSDRRHLSTVAEIDESIASDRLRYIAAYFAGHEGEAQFWVYEIARLENLRNIVLRQESES
ncbi:MAG: hypothetical protein QOG01_4651 [Pseudonocardiales bacterium]|jgi:hypothetical protein|nr:hypothetical protein [Pseudonocardiales bacterium]